MESKYFVFNNVPGAHPSWSIAVLAISLADAQGYMKIYNGGGKLRNVVKSGSVKADCGAITTLAEARLSLKV